MTTMQLQTLSILLVDSEPRFRSQLRSLLSFYPFLDNQPFTIVGEAATLTATLALAARQKPDLIILDLELAEGSGIEMMVQLREQGYAGRVLALSTNEADHWVFKAMQAGARGYIFKETLRQQLNPAIQTVMQGQVYLSPEVTTCFFRQFQFLNQNVLQVVRSLDLTEREQEVLHWLVQGESNNAIAHRLYVTVATVKAHLTSIFEKLEVRNRTQAIVKALRLGLICTGGEELGMC
ncbi:MAG: response regulator transcription factor [Spirulina sp. SIO3F2]|nr:response regulator transcription factor [Spirulina sp. SIO3F2]